MLKQRIITALVLLAILVPVIAHPDSRWFAAVSLVFIAAACWEFARLNGLRPVAALLTGGVGMALGAILWVGGALQVPLGNVWLGASCFWVLFSAWLLYKGAASWLALPQALRLVGGVVALMVAWLAVSRAHAMGINYLFSVLFLVWAADVGAYFAGRTLGGRFIRRKLAPSVSPGKTWEGAIGGFLTVVLVASVWQWGELQYGWGAAGLYTRLHAQGLLFYVVALLFLVTMSVVGDLVESLLKRSVGAKDSSQLLPGHGGVLDRVDALLPVLPMAMMLGTL
ncbi:phosphatidate cytidylyltransferase [Curvibacter sp. APW13]|uniref:phosphatidate cytidylyltransferase n=1 Tax=Curvibacter sp. APW13 TaxID=3077236 RepID=UPI0028DDBD0A|nr:phosphatidate cytidylyltransferase [Curvibacter sp. APW13]MDT8992080.1 phosphatidate cytidylyltransferase [Curvibacter sp. APW13]